MKRFISRYSFKLPRTLTYMLQNSEYIIPEYLNWLKNINDFRHVEKRKKLVYTKKSVLVLSMNWLILSLSLIAAYYLYIGFTNPTLSLIVPTLLLILIPQILGYLILIPLIVIKVFIQTPLETWIINQAKTKLKNNKALRIAIAGSYGKTSMKEILNTILSEKFIVAAPIHSYNTPLGISRFINGLSGEEDILIFELGEYHPNDIAKLCELVKPDIGIITGINEAHFQKFKSIEATAKTILELSEYLNNKNVFVNSENSVVNRYSKKSFIEYNKNGCGDISITKIKTDLKGTELTINTSGITIRTKTGLLGSHQVGPIAVASKIAKDLGMDIKNIANSIRNTKPFQHRLEPIEKGSDIIILDDTYNGNPNGVDAIIAFIKTINNRRKIYITPGLVEMGEQSEKIHEEIGDKLANAGIDKVVLIKNSATKFIENGLSKAGFKGDIIWFKDGPSAYKALNYITVKGDLVVMQNDWPDQYY